MTETRPKIPFSFAEFFFGLFLGGLTGAFLMACSDYNFYMSFCK